MEQEVHSLLVKEAIERVPPPDRESGFYGRYFIVPRKDGGLRPILDLRHLNRSLRRFRFKMLTIPTIVSQIRSEDWFVTIGLKDATSMFPSFLLTGSAWGSLSGGEAFQYRVLPFGQDKARPRYHCKAVPRTAGAHGSCVQRITFWPSVHETPTVVVKNQGVFLERSFLWGGTSWSCVSSVVHGGWGLRLVPESQLGIWMWSLKGCHLPPSKLSSWLR